MGRGGAWVRYLLTGGWLRRHDNPDKRFGGPPPTRRRSPHNCPGTLPLRRLCWSRTYVLIPPLMGAGVAIGCSVGHGGQKKRQKKCGVSQCIATYHKQNPTINIGSFCTKKRLSSMPLIDHTGPCVALPSWHPRRLAAPSGLRGLFF